MSRRKSAFWMKQLDERILEHLDREGWATPSIMAKTKGFSASEGHIRERCLMLQYTGFVAPITSDMYELTTDGIQYLRGQIDARHRPKPTVERVLNG
ncbi:hypothetical protein C442_08841 [Haloarcula amylolytica JCM 13557]|uniref:Uncharacterized protein n=2 Tax=Haloarcula TaxID=2237 RepID=A0A4P8JSX7_HALMA|nr:hypothetical protein C442_08841 [Haloarcula amylolytica JCM 13557]QCP90383.1 hypothetical protein E6P14_05730 [Haloarcula marismortui ATCC 43049]